MNEPHKHDELIHAWADGAARRKGGSVMSNYASLTICGVPTTLDPWELMHWIVQKTIQGQVLYAKGAFTPSGRLLPHSIDCTQRELTRSLLVRIMTDDGTYIINCGALTHIDTSPLPPPVETEESK